MTNILKKIDYWFGETTELLECNEWRKIERGMMMDRKSYGAMLQAGTLLKDKTL